MSLHNSTIIENRKRTFLNIVDLKEAIKLFSFTNSKPSDSGFDGEEEKQSHSRAFNARVKCASCGFDFDDMGQ